MPKGLTPEKIREAGRKEWAKILLTIMPPEDRLAGLSLKDRLAGFPKKEIEEYLQQLNNKEKSQ